MSHSDTMDTSRRPTADVTRVVGAHDTAAAFGSEFPPAASTPFVLGIAEVACHQTVAATLGHGEITVGTAAHIEHLVPTAVGGTLTAHATLTERDGRRLRFDVSVMEGEVVVARIEHLRAIVQRARIEQRLDAH
jgi:fluoroacetyl-CoA thioesterase